MAKRHTAPVPGDMSTEAEAVSDLVALSDAISERLGKASALLAVLRAADVGGLPDEVLHGYAWTVEDLVDEARDLHLRFWGRVRKTAGG